MIVRNRGWIVFACLGLLACGVAALGAQVPKTTLPLDPQRERGASITPAYEGWYNNPDGSFSLLLGYYNRNSKEALDIPVGPNNRVEPGQADQGQPTHFEIGRQWGVFAIRVPKDFGTKGTHMDHRRQRRDAVDSLTLNKGYPISPYEELGMHNKPPVLAFSEGGAKVTGPPTAVAATFTGTVNQPIEISIWVEDPKAPGEGAGFGGRGSGAVATISLHKFRGPGKVTFDKSRIPVLNKAPWSPSRPPSPPRATTPCGCRPTTSPARAAAGFSAAGPIPTRK